MYLRFKTLKFGCRVGSKEDRADPFQGGSRAVFVLTDSNSERWETPETLAWRVVAGYLRKLEKFRIQSSLWVYVCMLSCFSHVQLFATLWTIPRQAPLSMGFSRQESWSGLSCPPPGDLPDTGINPHFLSPALASGSLPLAPPGKLRLMCYAVLSHSVMFDSL